VRAAAIVLPGLEIVAETVAVAGVLAAVVVGGVAVAAGVLAAVVAADATAAVVGEDTKPFATDLTDLHG